MARRSIRSRLLLSLCLLQTAVVLWFSRQHALDTTCSSRAPLDGDSLAKKKTSAEALMTLASSGQEFSGERFRTFDGQVLFLNHTELEGPRPPDPGRHGSRCRSNRWAVLTTVQGPTEAVRRLLYRKKWCAVVVGDRAGPREYRFNHTDQGDNIIFLGRQEQIHMSSRFVDTVPWNSFARKNIGYLYAIAAGAEVIWDFDDDNMLKFWMEGASPDPRLEIETYTNITEQDKFEVSTPEHFVTCSSLLHSSQHRKTSLPVASLAVLQSLADHDPDVDAIFRLTKGTPINFKREASLPTPLVLPATGAFTPMNAQATLHFKVGFTALFLPSTVHGRVADIWRAYVGQAVFQVMGLRAGFLPRPLVVQQRNPHSFVADLQAEVPLYTQAGPLVEFLNKWVQMRRHATEALKDGIAPPFKSIMEEVYVALYERGFVEIEDVARLQSWLKALEDLVHLKDQRHVPLSLNEGSTMKADRNIKEAHPESCSEIGKGHLFWSSDMHDGTRSDSPTVLAHLGQSVVLAGYKQGLFPNRKALQEALNRAEGDVHVLGKLSPLLQNYKTHSHRLTQEEVERNFQHFVNSSVMKFVDAFICSFPAAMCQLWPPFNKSIVFLPAHRYNLGRCSLTDWKNLNDWLGSVSRDTTKPNLIGAMSRYDLEYLKHYTGLPDVRLVSSLSTFYLTNYKFRPTEDTVLVFGSPKSHFQHLLEDVKNQSGSQMTIRYASEVYGHWQFSDLVKHKAAVLLAYSVMSYKLTELYSLGIPLFIPSITYYKNHGGLGADRASTSPFYCGNTEGKWPDKHPSSSHPYDPNLSYQQDAEAEMYWLQLSDFYDWPHIQYFDDAGDLLGKLSSLKPMDVHENMAKSTNLRQHQTLDQWCQFIGKLDSSPTSSKHKDNMNLTSGLLKKL